MTSPRLIAAAAAALLALAAPVPALAAKGGGGGTSPAPAPAPARCLTAQATNSGQIDKPASRKPITVDVTVTNCGTQTITVGSSLVPTLWTQTAPGETSPCVGAAYGAQTLTLRPGKSDAISAAARVPYCGSSPYGVGVQYEVDYDLSFSDTADGSVLATAFSFVSHQGGA